MKKLLLWKDLIEHLRPVYENTFIATEPTNGLINWMIWCTIPNIALY